MLKKDTQIIIADRKHRSLKLRTLVKHAASKVLSKILELAKYMRVTSFKND